MSTPTAREALVAQLKEHLPRRWKVIDTQRALDERSQTTVQVRQTTITHLPQAPAGWLYTRFILTITTVHQDIVKAELQLDDDVLGLVHALDQIAGLVFEQAEKVMVEGQNRIGYDLTVHVPSHKKQE